MKKSLSLLLAIAMIFGAFASVALAADPTTTQEKFDALKAKGVFAGVNANGDAGLDQKMTRAQFARVLGLLDGLNVDAEPAKQDFTDVGPKHWAYQEVGAAFKAGLMVGIGGGKFNPNGNIIVQDLAVAVANVLGLKKVEGATVDGASAYAAGYIKALQDAGINLPTTYKVAATRAVLVDAAYAVYVKISTPAELKVSKAAQTGAKKITVELNRVATATEQKDAKFEVKNGLVNYPVTAKFAADGKSVVLEATFLPAADYTVKVNSLDPVTVKVADEVVSKLEIGATSIQKTKDQDLKVKAYNQFNEEVANVIGDQNINVYGSSPAGSIDAHAGKIDASAQALDSVVVVTVAHPTTGLSASKSFKVVDSSSAVSIKIGAVAPLTGNTRITAGDKGLVLPVTLADQYGGALTLSTTATAVSASSATFGDVKFVVSDSTVVDATSFAVDSKGVLTFTAKGPGTAVITAFNAKTGASAYTVVKVEAAAALKTFQVSNPGVLVVKDEKVILPYVAADSFGAPIAKKDVPAAVSALTTAGGKFDITANGVNVPYSWKANGDLEVAFATKGVTNVMVWVNGAIASQLALDVKDTAYPVSIVGTQDLNTTMTVDAVQGLTASNLVIRDNYGRTMSSVSAPWVVSFVDNDTAATSKVAYASGKVKGQAVGTESVTAKIVNGASTVSFDIPFTVIADTDVKSLTVGTVGTIYGDKALTSADLHAVTLSLTGKTADGKDVAILPANFFDLVTTSNADVVALKSSTELVVYGKAAGTAKVTVWKNGSKLSEQTVTVSDVKPLATSVAFSTGEATVTTTPLDASKLLSVKDQYGVAIDDTGKWYSSDTKVATVSAAGLVTKVARGIATITYVSSNGISASFVVNAE